MNMSSTTITIVLLSLMVLSGGAGAGPLASPSPPPQAEFITIDQLSPLRTSLVKVLESLAAAEAMSEQDIASVVQVRSAFCFQVGMALGALEGFYADYAVRTKRPRLSAIQKSVVQLTNRLRAAFSPQPPYTTLETAQIRKIKQELVEVMGVVSSLSTALTASGD